MSRALVVIRTRKQWANHLNKLWDELRRNTVASFIDFGRELLTAKAGVKHGEFMEMVRDDLEVDHHVANMFMRIARCENVSSAHTLLPPDYTTIDKLTRLEPQAFRRMVKDGTINPALKRNEVSKVLRLARVAEDEQRVRTLRPVEGCFRTLVLDPAWEYTWLSRGARAKPGYAMQTLEQLRDLDVAAWADRKVGTHLYLWTTNNFMAEACKLVAHWGFQHRSVLTWVKPAPFGLGAYFRNSTEHALFATLGDTATRPLAAKVPTHFTAPRGQHSEKPERFYQIVRACSYPPYGEGNQRKPRRGFASLYCPATSKLAEAAE